jgi:hypothetical protein
MGQNVVGCQPGLLGVFAEYNRCMVGRATLPIGLWFGTSAAGQISVNCPSSSYVDNTRGLAGLPPGQSRGTTRAIDRASLTFRRVTVRQPAVDARLDVHREPVSLLVSF